MYLKLARAAFSVCSSAQSPMNPKAATSSLKIGLAYILVSPITLQGRHRRIFLYANNNGVDQMSSKHVFSLLQINVIWPGRVAQSVGHLTRKSEVLGSIPGLATYFRFSFR